MCSNTCRLQVCLRTVHSLHYLFFLMHVGHTSVRFGGWLTCFHACKWSLYMRSRTEVFLPISIYRFLPFAYSINNLETAWHKKLRGQAAFHNLLQLSVEPLIRPDNAGILRLARGHVLITCTRQHPSEHVLIHVREGESSLHFYLLGCDG